MPVSRRRSSVLGHGTEWPSERPRAAGTCRSRVTVSSGVCGPRAPSTGTRMTRRALGISSMFLQGTRCSTAPVAPKTGPAASGLGWSLVDYRDKVQALEQLNLELESQIRNVLQQRADSATSWEPLRAQWEQLYRQVSEWILSNARLRLESENIQNNADDFKDRVDSQRPWRQDLEDEIDALHKVVDEATQTRVDLQQRSDDLWAELQQLQLEHQQDVRGLYTQMSAQDLDEPDLTQTGLDQVLDHIRTHWERVCEENRLRSNEENQREKQEPVSLSPDQEKIEGLKTEIQDAANKLQSLQAQTESLRALKRGLEASLADARRWQDVELQNLGSVVSRLEAELNQVRGEAETQRRDLDTLVSNKQRLEHEVALYHALLQGEEARYGDRLQGEEPDEGRGQEEETREAETREAETREAEISEAPQQQQLHAEPGEAAPDTSAPDAS